MADLVCAVSEDDAQRLRELYSYDLLDTPPEAELDRIVELIARMFKAPYALLSLLDAKRQWFKSR